MLIEYRNDFSRLDTVSSDLDLLIIAPQKRDLTIGEEASQVTRLI